MAFNLQGMPSTRQRKLEKKAIGAFGEIDTQERIICNRYAHQQHKIPFRNENQQKSDFFHIFFHLGAQ